MSNTEPDTSSRRSDDHEGSDPDDDAIAPFEGLMNPDDGDNTPASDADAQAPG